MANPEHISWLLEGAEHWNARRESEPFTPDLSELHALHEFREAGKTSGHNKYSVSLTRVNLAQASLEGADFRGFDLSEASLRESSLEGAILERTRLERADLESANLAKAVLSYAILDGAQMSKADLTKCVLNGASLRNANLANARLIETVLDKADLVGANLLRSRPWTAKLFPLAETGCESDAEYEPERPVESIRDLLDFCRSAAESHPKNVLYFRGERADYWSLCPSAMRLGSVGDPLVRSAEGAMLLDLISRRPDDFEDSLSALAQWVLGQHHGLKTRLLDVTRNPLVALFHACEPDAENAAGRLHVFSVPRKLIKPFSSDAISIVANFAKLPRHQQDVLLGRKSTGSTERGSSIPGGENEYVIAVKRLYQLIRREKPHFEEDIDPRDLFRVFVVEPQQRFDRLRAQSGAFLLSAFHERFERREVVGKAVTIPLYCHYTLTVAQDKKQKIRRELRLVDVTEETLFPGLESAARAVMRHHEGLVNAQE